MLYIGNHTSSSKGYLAMGKQMLANGGNTFAFFTRNPRGGKAKEINPQDVQAFFKVGAGESFRQAGSACAIYNELLCCEGESERVRQRDNGG